MTETASRRGGLGRQAPAAESERRHDPSPAVYPRWSERSRLRRLFVETPRGERCVGVLEEREGQVVLTKRVNRARHLLRLPEEAWAIDAEVLRQAEAAGATRVEIADERGRRWWTRLDYLLAEGERFDRGWGRQVRLPLVRWSFLPGRRGRDV